MLTSVLTFCLFLSVFGQKLLSCEPYRPLRSSGSDPVLNTKKIKETIVNFREHSSDLAPLHINGDSVERVHTFRFLDVFISTNIS